MYVAVYGGVHLDVAATHCNMGVVYGRQGDHVRGQALFQKALDVQMQVAGFKRPHVAESHVCLAWISMKQGQASECQAHLERALDMGFLWEQKSFLEVEDVFDAVRQAAWFREMLANAKHD